MFLFRQIDGLYGLFFLHKFFPDLTLGIFQKTRNLFIVMFPVAITLALFKLPIPPFQRSKRNINRLFFSQKLN